MRGLLKIIVAAMVIAALCGNASVYAQAPQIVSVSPAQSQVSVDVSTVMSVVFDLDMDATTINSSTFWVNAAFTGLRQGSIAYDNSTRTATFTPSVSFEPGEPVTPVVTTGMQAADGTPLTGGYAWSFTSAVSGGYGTFGPFAASYPVGLWPYAACAADFDSDGDLDMAAANYLSSNVTLLVNSGGSFSTGATYASGTCPISIASGDLDGDNDIDLVTANVGSSDISVLLNNGDGSFAGHLEYGAQAAVQSIVTCDLDSDGDLDLATVTPSEDKLAVSMNAGDGTFGQCISYSVGNNPVSMSATDVDGDGDFDLVTANAHSDDLSVLVNDGAGVFGSRSDYSVGAYPHGVCAADFDSDGDPDLAVVNYGDDNVAVLLNAGDGTFPSSTTYAVGDMARSICAADFNGDGSIDVVTAGGGAPAASVLLNTGNGNFDPQVSYTLDNVPHSALAADLDGDGDMDVAMATRNSGDICVLLNDFRTDVGFDGAGALPGKFSLGQNYPNPFNPTTEFEYSLAARSHVEITVVNIVGQVVRTLVDESRSAGWHIVVWDGTDDANRQVASGVYIYQLSCGLFTESKKMILLK